MDKITCPILGYVTVCFLSIETLYIPSVIGSIARIFQRTVRGRRAAVPLESFLNLI
jgi:hypothetical protein